MAKTKHKKYERVRHLPNVFIPGERPGEHRPPWPAGKKTILELGCGKGEHALTLAGLHPDTLVVGVDIKSHRLCTGGEKALAMDLDNLFFLRADIGTLDAWFAPGAVTAIWITFPDPHPKQREIKHRLTSPGFMAMYAALLAPGGTIHVKTDSDLFYDYTLGTVQDWGGTVEVRTGDLYGRGELPRGAAAVPSAFEQKARERGKTIKYLAFTLN